ncbi:MAG: hypothetical protein GY820_22310, partial [Gammaproteobacteria bacterium]|nr:hypothetical protein [Gammaproteobacteria bacterium]
MRKLVINMNTLGKAVLLSLALVMFAGHLLAAGETIVPSSDFGGHRETVEDLRVKVQGG